MMTCLHLQILLHYYCSAEDWNCLSPTHTDYRQGLITDGLVALGAGFSKTQAYGITDKGRFHVEHLLSTPLPKPFQTWRYESQEPR